MQVWRWYIDERWVSPAVEVKGGGAVVTAKETPTITTGIAEWVVLYTSVLLTGGGYGGRHHARLSPFLLPRRVALRWRDQRVNFLQRERSKLQYNSSCVRE